MYCIIISRCFLYKVLPNYSYFILSKHFVMCRDCCVDVECFQTSTGWKWLSQRLQMEAEAEGGATLGGEESFGLGV